MWQVGFTIYGVWFWADKITNEVMARRIAANIAVKFGMAIAQGPNGEVWKAQAGYDNAVNWEGP
jgi:hypothetical protein